MKKAVGLLAALLVLLSSVGAYAAETAKILGDANGDGACREFFMQLDERNENMEIMSDYENRETVFMKSLIPDWWGKERCDAVKIPS